MDLSKIRDLKDLQAMVDLMERYGLVELEIEGDGQKVRLRKAEPGSAREGFTREGLAGAISGSPLPGAAPAAHHSSPVAAQPDASSHLKEIASPMVGTFYRSSSPEAEPYVKEGDLLTPDATLCIIEAMKVMNEIPAGVSGVVREILVKNGESVEFGQPLFRIEVE